MTTKQMQSAMRCVKNINEKYNGIDMSQDFDDYEPESCFNCCNCEGSPIFLKSLVCKKTGAIFFRGSSRLCQHYQDERV